MTKVDILSEAAKAALESLSCPDLRYVEHRLACFLDEHIRKVLDKEARTEGEIKAWQWDSLVLAWATETAGILRVKETDYDCFLDYIQQLGLATEAKRAVWPYGKWHDGQPGVIAGVNMPGMRSRNASKLNKVMHPLLLDARNCRGGAP